MENDDKLSSLFNRPIDRLDPVFVTPNEWPKDNFRTHPDDRLKSRFTRSPKMAVADLAIELRRWGAYALTIATDLEPIDGGRWIRMGMSDSSVTLIWRTDDDTMVLASDHYDDPFANIIFMTRNLAAIRIGDKKKDYTVLPRRDTPRSIHEPTWTSMQWLKGLGIARASNGHAFRDAFRSFAKSWQTVTDKEANGSWACVHAVDGAARLLDLMAATSRDASELGDGSVQTSRYTMFWEQLSRDVFECRITLECDRESLSELYEYRTVLAMLPWISRVQVLEAEEGSSQYSFCFQIERNPNTLAVTERWLHGFWFDSPYSRWRTH